MSDANPLSAEVVKNIAARAASAGNGTHEWTNEVVVALCAALAAVEAERDEARMTAGAEARARGAASILRKDAEDKLAAALAEVERLKEALVDIDAHAQTETHDHEAMNREFVRARILAALAPQPEVKGEQP